MSSNLTYIKVRFRRNVYVHGCFWIDAANRSTIRLSIDSQYAAKLFLPDAYFSTTKKLVFPILTSNKTVSEPKKM